MAVVLVAMVGLLVAFAVPYWMPRVGVVGGVVGMAVASVMMLHRPEEVMTGQRGGPTWLALDFDMARPIGIALGLYALLWLLVSAIQISRRAEAV
jgi:hypothetical protein